MNAVEKNKATKIDRKSLYKYALSILIVLRRNYQGKVLKEVRN